MLQQTLRARKREEGKAKDEGWNGEKKGK